MRNIRDAADPDGRSHPTRKAKLRPWQVVLLAALASSCSLLLRPQEDTFPGLDGDDDALGDSDEPDVPADADLDADLDEDDDQGADVIVFDREEEEPPTDADLDGEGSDEPDAEEVLDLCSEEPASDFIAIFPFDDALASTSGGFEWRTPVIATGCRRFDVGAARGCDWGLYFDDCPAESWLELANEAAWDTIRAIDFWFQPLEAPPGGEEGPRRYGILSRDASGETDPGHFNIYLHRSLRIVLRMQDNRTDSGEVFLCSNGALELERWHHVEVRFGLPQLQLWIDGERQLGEGNFGGTCTADAMASLPHDISGNDEPWVLGALNSGSARNSALPVIDELRAGAIDHLRFSRVRPEEPLD